MRPRNIEKEESIRAIALKIIQEEGLENLSMQKLAKAANVSPRTIYIKYENKEDLLIKLFIDEVLGTYEAAVLENFDESMAFSAGVKRLWQNSFRYFQHNQQAFALMQYGKSSPLLNKAFRERDIKEGQFFAPIHRFMARHAKAGTIQHFQFQVHRALLFAPLFDLINEYVEHINRPTQPITEKLMLDCCQMVINGMLIETNKHQ